MEEVNFKPIDRVVLESEEYTTKGGYLIYEHKDFMFSINKYVLFSTHTRTVSFGALYVRSKGLGEPTPVLCEINDDELTAISNKLQEMGWLDV